MELNYLITGGAGFIGCNLVKLLLATRTPKNIRIVDNLVVGSLKHLSQITSFKDLTFNANDVSPIAMSKVEFYKTDILDKAAALRLCENVDVIIHLAANTGVLPSIKNPRFDCETNVIGTLNYLEAARTCGVKKFIFASTSAAIGQCEPPVRENVVAQPHSPYGASKLAGEGYCSAYHRSFGLDTVALRFGNVYGPFSNHKESVVAKFIRNIISGEDLVIYGDGHQTRDFIFVDDIVEAIARLAEIDSHKTQGEVFQLATQEETEIRTIVDLLLKKLAVRASYRGQVKYFDERKGEIKRIFSDITKLKSALDWKPKYNIDQGLDKTIDWYM